MKILRLSLAFALLTSSALIIAEANSATTSQHKKKKTKTEKTVSTPIVKENVRFLEWKEVQDLKQLMRTEYQFNEEEFDRIFQRVRFVESAIQLMKPMPIGKPKNWKIYRSRFVETARVNAGLAFWERNESVLQKAETEFGIPAEIIVGLIGVETIYGKNMGKFNAIDAITTLAFSYPDTPNKEVRSTFFKNELVQLLLWARESKIDPLQIKASYAGAIGLCQFMPSSLRSFAIDFDKDGKIDLRESETDAIGSVANYLAQHGWKKGLPYAFPASLNSSNALAEITAKEVSEILGKGLRATFTLDQLRPRFTTPDSNAPASIMYGVVDLQNGDEQTEYWLGTENFFAITQYNRSYFYAMSVIDLGKAINLARTKN